MRLASLVALVLYFDGSLRYPNDPGLPSERQCPRAACAACIVDDLSSANTTKVLLLGGRLLQCSFQRTSGEVEYQGLLLGLEGLLTYFSDIMTSAYYPTPPVPHLPSRATKQLVRVRGDCKTVLQQMEGLAHPRKLEAFYKRAQDMIDKLTSKYRIEFQFEHIQRNKNQLCDRLAAQIIQKQEWQDYQSAVRQLQQLGPRRSESSTTLAMFMEDHLTIQSNAIPYSKRPPFYQFLAKECFQKGDYPLLVRIGEQFEKEVKQVWPRSGFKQHRLAEELLVEAIVYQIIGLQKQPRRTREAVARQRKRRFIMEKWKSLCSDVERCLCDELSTELESLLDVVQGTPQVTHEDDSIASLVEMWYAEAQSSGKWGTRTCHCVHWLNLLT